MNAPCIEIAINDNDLGNITCRDGTEAVWCGKMVAGRPVYMWIRPDGQWVYRKRCSGPHCKGKWQSMDCFDRSNSLCIKCRSGRSGIGFYGDWLKWAKTKICNSKQKSKRDGRKPVNCTPKQLIETVFDAKGRCMNPWCQEELWYLLHLNHNGRNGDLQGVTCSHCNTFIGTIDDEWGHGLRCRRFIDDVLDREEGSRERYVPNNIRNTLMKRIYQSCKVARARRKGYNWAKHSNPNQIGINAKWHQAAYLYYRYSNGNCMACGKFFGFGPKLLLDHDGRISVIKSNITNMRGFLCNPCNTWCGHLDDVSGRSAGCARFLAQYYGTDPDIPHPLLVCAYPTSKIV